MANATKGLKRRVRGGIIISSKGCKETIERLLQVQKMHQEIVEAIGVSKTTIYGELGRNWTCGRYKAEWTQNRSIFLEKKTSEGS